MKYILAIALTISLVSCGKKPKAKLGPEHDLAIAVIQDMYVAEAVLAKTNVSIKDSMAGVYRQQILQMHNLDSTRLEIILRDIKDDIDLYYLVQDAAINGLKPKKD